MWWLIKEYVECIKLGAWNFQIASEINIKTPLKKSKIMHILIEMMMSTQIASMHLTEEYDNDSDDEVYCCDNSDKDNSVPGHWSPPFG